MASAVALKSCWGGLGLFMSQLTQCHLVENHFLKIWRYDDIVTKLYENMMRIWGYAGTSVTGRTLPNDASDGDTNQAANIHLDKVLICPLQDFDPAYHCFSHGSRILNVTWPENVDFDPDQILTKWPIIGSVSSPPSLRMGSECGSSGVNKGDPNLT